MIHSWLHGAQARPAWRWLLLLMMLVVCFLAFSAPAQGLEFDNADKWQHLAAFCALGACASLALAPGWRGAAAAALGMLAFGMFIEAVQWFVPNRSAEWADVLADACGIALGLLVAMLARRLWPAQELQAAR